MITAETGTFLEVEDAESFLGIPSLGFIPMIDKVDFRLIRDVSHVSPLTESYRSLRTNLYFAGEKPIRSLLITSAIPGEGKSMTAANLAMVMAMDGKIVIVVDGDLRRPTQHKLFKQEATPGLSDVLMETHSLREAIHPTDIPNISLIPAGTPTPDAPELFGSGALGRLLTKLEKICDIVIVDTPPVLAVVGAAIAASQADGVLLVIGMSETKRIKAEQTIKILSRVRSNVLGTAINRVEGLSSSYYYGKYYVPSETSTEISSKEKEVSSRSEID